MFALAALFGAAVAVLPALAASETPTINAVNYGLYSHYWSPSTTSVAAGGVVTVANATEVPHGVEWKEGPEKPACSSGVPVGTSEASSGTKWSGTCTFVTPGTYKFWCTVHHSEMTETVTVNASGTTTSTGTTTSPPPTTTGTGSTSTPTAPAALPGSAGPSPLAGSVGSAVRLAARQRGRTVRGSLDVSQAGVGGRLEVDLLAARSALASTGHSRPVLAGQLVRSHLAAGSVSFAVHLNARARHALSRRRRLTLTVRIVLRPLVGAAVTVTRSVHMRA
jgi:plastocyanin